MSKFFGCVLWMPTVVYKDFEDVEEKESDIFEVSDSLDASLISEYDDSRLYVSMALHANHDVDIRFYPGGSYRDSRRDATLDVRLHHIYHSRNGMFVYSVESECENHPVFYCISDSHYKFPCDLYHRIKSFYHEHSFHEGDDGDSVLKPYLEELDSDDADNVDSILRNASMHYLRLYDKRFASGYKYLKINYNSLVNCSALRKFTFFFQAKKHLSFYRLATALQGDRIYVNTLLASSQETDIERAFNVDNIQKSIELMVYCIDNKLGITNARISFWIAILAIVISICMAL